MIFFRASLINLSYSCQACGSSKVCVIDCIEKCCLMPINVSLTIMGRIKIYNDDQLVE